MLTPDIATRLRAACGAAGLTQAVLAARAGVDRVTVARYESGTVTPAADTHLRLLQACRTPPTADLDPDDLALLDAQLARTPEGRLHASHELARLRASARA